MSSISPSNNINTIDTPISKEGVVTTVNYIDSSGKNHTITDHKSCSKKVKKQVEKTDTSAMYMFEIIGGIFSIFDILDAF